MLPPSASSTRFSTALAQAIGHARTAEMERQVQDLDPGDPRPQVDVVALLADKSGIDAGKIEEMRDGFAFKHRRRIPKVVDAVVALLTDDHRAAKRLRSAAKAM